MGNGKRCNVVAAMRLYRGDTVGVVDNDGAGAEGLADE